MATGKGKGGFPVNVSLLGLIEETRRKMIETACLRGLNDEETIGLSKRLDRLMNLHRRNPVLRRACAPDPKSSSMERANADSPARPSAKTEGRR